MKRLLILLIMFFGNFIVANAQSFDEEEKAKKDSTLYRNIYEQSQQNRINKIIYDLVFRRPRNEKIDSSKNKQIYNPGEYFDQKIIRNIIIVNKDPFNINDESGFFTKNNLHKTGNFLHTNTRSFIIKGLLLFGENDKYDSLLIKESERLLRSQTHIEESAIYGMALEESNDSVDILVMVKDKFSLYPEAEISSSRFGVGLKETNLLGMGHQAHIYYAWNYSGTINNYQYDYKIPNVLSTYINTGIIYNKNNANGSRLKQFYAERPFYSSVTKLAGGLNIKQQAQKYDINIPNTNDFINQKFKYNVLDFWGAYAFNIKSKNTLKARTRKFVLSARYYHIDYLESPSEEYDPLNVYSNENFYFLSMGISKRNYRKDSYLFRYGFTEDVPTGYNFNLISGVQRKNGKSRLYMATEISIGKYFKPGYFSAALEYGSFFDKANIKEGVFTAELNYFTPLLEIDKWKFRQFIKIQYMGGIDRLETDRLSLYDYFGISGFNTNAITGVQKIVCNFQTQVFTPYSFWGFKIAPYFVYSMGMLGNEKSGFNNSKVYSLFGFGFLIRNDYLVFNSFEISISFYPHIPERGSNIFKFNTYEISDFRLNDYDIKKPEQVEYR